MAGACKRFTLQRVGSSVTVISQGGKAGPQSPSSIDRSSSLVDDLANEESNATRKLSNEIQQSHDCVGNRDSFCYICSKYEVPSLRRKINKTICDLYEKMFEMKVDQQNSWVPRIICNVCRKMLGRWETKKVKKNLRFSSSTI